MNKLWIAVAAMLLCFVGAASASYYVHYGGSYGAMSYPNSNYYISESSWGYGAGYGSVSRSVYTAYGNASYSYGGYAPYYSYYPSAYYYAPYYSYYPYASYSYYPGYNFGYY